MTVDNVLAALSIAIMALPIVTVALVIYRIGRDLLWAYRR